MFTNQAARQVDSLTAPPSSPMWFKRWMDEFRTGMRQLVGNCGQPLEHRGPLEIRNTHADVEIPPEGEPGITICTSRAGDQLPTPPPVALFVECGESVFQDVHIEGDLIVDGTTIFNDCVVFNSGIVVYGAMANRRAGYSSTIVRFCLTSVFDPTAKCASAQVYSHVGGGGGSTGSGSASCYPAYGSGSTANCAGGSPAITVIDRGGRFTTCSEVGDCGYAAYFSTSVAVNECNEACTDGGEGVYEVIQMYKTATEYNNCYVDVVTRVCCVAGTLVNCVRRITFPSPVKLGAIDCGGSGSAVCT